MLRRNRDPSRHSKIILNARYRNVSLKLKYSKKRRNVANIRVVRSIDVYSRGQNRAIVFFLIIVFPWSFVCLFVFSVL